MSLKKRDVALEVCGKKMVICLVQVGFDASSGTQKVCSDVVSAWREPGV